MTPRVTGVTRALLRGPLAIAEPDASGSKEDRGRVLVIGGATELAGALTLAGTAALRAGAGKLQLATCASLVPALSVAVPEARVFPLAQAPDGSIAGRAAPKAARLAAAAQAVLVGPGMLGVRAIATVVRRVVAALGDESTLVLDAAAIEPLRRAPDALHRLAGRAVLTPNEQEVCLLLGADEAEVASDPATVARRLARALRAVIALKGAETHIAAPSGACYRYTEGGVGLATSGSGDVLSGLIAGLAARGATPLQAAVWGVFLHGAAGNALARRMGPIGALARELSGEVPALAAALSRRGRR
ncbi:MAG: NAD(P)H-hydrate dehydratase [Gemmatimonadaceae bacterium]